MPTFRQQSLEFQSYQGLQRIVRSATKIHKPLEEIAEWLQAIDYSEVDLDDVGNVKVGFRGYIDGNGKKQDGYVYNSAVRLLDTFLVSSIESPTLTKIFKDSRKLGFPIQILLLDPNSQAARQRAAVIANGNGDDDASSIIQSNQSLDLVLRSLRLAVEDKDADEELKTEVVWSFETEEAIQKRLNIIRKFKEGGLVDIEVRFYSVDTEAPYYILSRFLAKGLRFHDVGASNHPWLIFIDDHTQPGDMYDTFSANFDDIWANASTPEPERDGGIRTPDGPDDSPDDDSPDSEDGQTSTVQILSEGPTKIFIIHGHDHDARDDVELFLRQKGLEPIILDKQAFHGRTVIEQFELHAEVSTAIALFTADDVGVSVRDSNAHVDNDNNINIPQMDKAAFRARQNVLVETGYFMGKIGRGSVVLLAEPSVEIPSDFGGLLRVDFDSSVSWQIALLKQLQSLGFDVR